MSKAKKSPSGNPARSKNPGHVEPARFGDWVAGARFRTLSLAVAPVLIGTGAAIAAGQAHEYHWVRGLAALVVALFLQIGVNYANDFSDGVRGTDEVRVGPGRLTGSGKAKPRTVLIVALSFFAVAAIVGIGVVIDTRLWWLLVVGALAIVAGWFYTGGKHPYGYFGLGELFVFLFFGLAAVLGTQYVEIGFISGEGWFGAVAAGLLACAVLMVNNLRDIDQDRAARKRTLAVLIGRIAGRVLYGLFMLVPFLIIVTVAFVYPIAWLGLLVLLVALPAAIITFTSRTPRDLIVALQLTSLTALAYAVVLGLAFAF